MLPPVLQRFQLDESTGCWVWTATKRDGYGVMQWKRKPHSAHRIFAHMFLGFPLDARSVCHRCDNPSCVNPAHLFIGTPADNTRDMVNKGRHVPRPQATECPKGHPYDSENTYYNRSSGGRTCRRCHRDKQRQEYANKLGRPIRKYNRN